MLKKFIFIGLFQSLLNQKLHNASAGKFTCMAKKPNVTINIESRKKVLQD